MVDKNGYIDESNVLDPNPTNSSKAFKPEFMINTNNLNYASP